MPDPQVPDEADERSFRRLARSSIERWQAVQFRVYWKGGLYEDVPAVRAWVERPGRLRVEHLHSGQVLQVDAGGIPSSPAHHQKRPPSVGRLGTSPTELGPGLAITDEYGRKIRSSDATFQQPFFRDYRWLAMLDPIELADSTLQKADSAPVRFGQMRLVAHHGRPALEAEVTPTPAYTPLCACCALLFSRESDAALRSQGREVTGSWDPKFAYPESHLVRLDMQTGICVLSVEVGGSRPGRGHELILEEVNPQISDDRFEVQQ